MKTEFKVFKGSHDSLGELIKKYQKEHHLEIKNVVFLEIYNAKTIIGVIFERDMVSLFNSKYRDSCKSALDGFLSCPVPGGY